jgi:hypothetical protein
VLGREEEPDQRTGEGDREQQRASTAQMSNAMAQFLLLVSPARCAATPT